MDITANLIRGAWLVFVLYWIFASLSVNRIRKREPAGSRLMRWAAVIITLVLLNTNLGSVGFLGRRFIPWNPSLPRVGAALAVAGIAFAIWARVHIGRYWSGSVALKVGHELIRTGPYAYIRHPSIPGFSWRLRARLSPSAATARCWLSSCSWRTSPGNPERRKHCSRRSSAPPSTSIAAAPAFSSRAFPDPRRHVEFFLVGARHAVPAKHTWLRADYPPRPTGASCGVRRLAAAVCRPGLPGRAPRIQLTATLRPSATC